MYFGSDIQDKTIVCGVSIWEELLRELVSFSLLHVTCSKHVFFLTFAYILSSNQAAALASSVASPVKEFLQ